MTTIRMAFSIQALAVCLFVNACAGSHPAEDTVLMDGPRGAVSLQSVEDSWFKATHPGAVSPSLLTHVLRGVQVQSAADDQTTAVQVFSDEEIAFLSPLMSTALSKATKSQLVAFRVTQSTDPGGATTSGLLFTRGRLLHLWLTHYRAPSIRTDTGTTLDRQARNPQGLGSRQLRFVPETAQRPSRNQQPDVIDPPPLATLVIDYTMLATALNLPSEAVPSQLLQRDASPGPHAEHQSAQPGHGLPASQDTLQSRDAETQALKDVVKEQAIELDALKEDVRVLRRKLSELEVPSSNLTKPPLALPRREESP